MYKKILFSASLIALLHISMAGCITSPDDTQPDLHLTLSGHLLDEEEWGPPNFGDDPKHDMKYKIILLKLDTPMSICNPQDTNADLKTLDCIQIGNACSTPLTPYTGKHITISGDAFGADNAWKITPLVMNCQKYTQDNTTDLSPAALTALKTYRCNSTAWSGFRINAKS
jgi:hypothetical protein